MKLKTCFKGSHWIEENSREDIAVPDTEQKSMTNEELLIEVRRPRPLGGLPHHLKERHDELRAQRTSEWLGKFSEVLRASNW